MTPLSRLLADVADDAPVAWRGDEIITAGRFRADVAAAIDQAGAAGCRRGALVCADGYWFAVGLFGLLGAGATVVVPPNAQPGTLAALAHAYDRRVADTAAEGALVLAPGRAGAAPAPLDAAACRLEFFTSGSTGEPKCVAKTLAELETEVLMLERLWGPGLGRAPVLATVPHHHIYGLTFRVLWPLAAGRPFAARAHDVWETLLADLPPGAVVVSSPAHLTRLGGLAPLGAGGPRMVLSAGAPLSFAAARQTARILGVLPTEIYGSTETGAVATRRQEGDEARWRPLPGVSLGLSGDGRIALRSPWVEPQGWVETDDLAAIDADGGFTLLGRADRVAKIEGKRVALAEVERALAALPLVADAAVVVLPGGAAGGEPAVLAAAVVPTAEGAAEIERLGRFRFTRTLRRALSATLEPAGLPRRWRFVGAIPAGSMGKRPMAAVARLFEEPEHG